MNPILPLAALGIAAFTFLAGKQKPSVEKLPATPAPSGAASQTVKVGTHTWKLVGAGGGATDVFAPAGSWGNHGELRVLRFTGSSGARLLAGVAEGVPANVLAAAKKDLAISEKKSGQSGATGKAMPESLQKEMIAAMMALGVDSTGVVKGPVTAVAIRNATELSSRLEQAKFPQAAQSMRNYAQQAGKFLPTQPATVPPVPGVPATLMSQVQRALELERDPQKLSTLRTALAKVPASPQRDALLGSLDALILQVRQAQAISQAATDIDEMTKPKPTAAPVPSSTTTGTRVLKLTKPNMKGDDVKAWQNVLRAAGYNVDNDGVFGPGTEAATKDWQSKRGLTPDGKVGSDTRAKIGTAPTAPLAVPAAPSPQRDPTPKTALQVSAESTATHLLALQQKHGVKGSKGKQDTALVKRFQVAASGTGDGMPGPGTMLSLARNGIGTLPQVMYWPKAATKAKDLPAYKQNLRTLAASARSGGNPTLGAQLEASADREVGAGGL